MTFSKKERDMYNKDRNIICACLGITVNQYNWFRRMGEKLHKIYENDCNGLYESEDIALVLAEEIMQPTTLKANKLGLDIYYQTDPRGATIYLDTKPIAKNAYNNAHCIY